MTPQKLLTFQKPDGGVALYRVLREFNPDLQTEQSALAAEEADLRKPKPSAYGGMTAIVPDDWIRVTDTDPATVPEDRTFRAAWVPDGGSVAHNMEKCRDIHKERLRQIRAPKLAALDVDYLRALESSDIAAMTVIAAKKAELRDVTQDPAIVLAETPEALKAVLPDALKA